jgi:hypothetical protein
MHALNSGTCDKGNKMSGLEFLKLIILLIDSELNFYLFPFPPPQTLLLNLRIH